MYFTVLYSALSAEWMDVLYSTVLYLLDSLICRCRHPTSQPPPIPRRGPRYNNIHWTGLCDTKARVGMHTSVSRPDVKAAALLSIL